MFCFSLKLDCEKLASEKIEIQRHYVMVSRKMISQSRYGIHDHGGIKVELKNAAKRRVGRSKLKTN